MGAAGIFRAVLGGKGARRRSREEKFILFPKDVSVANDHVHGLQSNCLRLLLSVGPLLPTC
jgi:hypothetical protein